MVTRSLVLGVFLGIAIYTACTVDRKTSDYACSTDAECTHFSPSRHCDTALGYCVLGGGSGSNDKCPDFCNGGCVASSHECVASCTQTNDCKDINCPAGWSCTFTCQSSHACDTIHCQGDANCTFTCQGDLACTDLTCGAGSCDVTCAASGACDTVTCSDSCSCDVTCSNGAACNTISCPDNQCRSQNGCSSSQSNCPTTCR